MLQLLNYSSYAAGVFGILLCTISGLSRFQGSYYVGSYEGTTLFMVGTGLMVFACLIKLEILLKKSSGE